jgi:periplasmic protein TonB
VSGERARAELQEAERWMGAERAERRMVVRALAAAVIVHAIVLVARLPGWGPEPVRVDALSQPAMQVQFLSPPAPKAAPKPPEPKAKRIPRPDPTPDELEPKAAPEPAPPAESLALAPAQPGPMRVSPGQGPGLIKKVEPRYPPLAQAARLEGNVVIDAIILKDGSVSDVRVLRSTNRLFEQPCIEAVKQWRFSPGSQDVILTVTVNFTLRP